MNSSQIKALVRAGEDVRKSVGDGLYFRVEQGTASWFVRYTYAGRRKTITLPEGYPICSLADAKIQAAAIRSKVKNGIDPQLERRRESGGLIHTVDDLFNDWFQRSVKSQVKHPGNDERVYRNHIKSRLGKYSIRDITPIDIRTALDELRKIGNKTTASRALSILKRMFNHGIKLNLVTSNPAIHFTGVDVGQNYEPRKRFLSLDEIRSAFTVFRDNQDIFTRDNYLAFLLLIHLGCRKTEITSSRWEQIDLENQTWFFPENKTSKPITVPIPDQLMPVIEELRVRCAGSQCVFPARRRSKRREYISDDTLNHALAKLFGQKVDSKKQPYPNVLGSAGVDYFTVQDLRRTYRTLLAQLKIPDNIAERCLNHELRGVLKVYNQHDYLEERREANTKVAELLEPLLHGGGNE
ncbi:tyrosine-type recombinase/integrase [Idiomarina sp. PL1-037]|uniref:tyrosine-type recombinase/integrase n=1 Tax=Idiomarina sp. PL1-037 TaxID=3095365 RepID=UPI002ACC26BE|nr:integrase arm-type DNA-binding domain-containing protein [Idiomarina sp. PL1-037]WQC52842.1 tyrosine-type recombinase/integrase [Idiomarina sp. PL1-037]